MRWDCSGKTVDTPEKNTTETVAITSRNEQHQTTQKTADNNYSHVLGQYNAFVIYLEKAIRIGGSRCFCAGVAWKNDIHLAVCASTDPGEITHHR